MQLFVIRHATAVPRSPDIDDPLRPLTDQGKKRWRRAVKGLDDFGIRVDRVYHSPWLRAVETAEAMKRLVRGETIATARLAESPTPALLDELAGDRVALVGHEPWLGQLIALLVTGDASLGDRFPLRKGGVAWLDGDHRSGGMHFVALLPPRILRRLRE